MAGGEVQTLLILGGNPAYTAPSDLGFAELLAKVPNSIHLSLHDDETSRLCAWHLPRAHPLEAWGDGRAWDGSLTMQQPLIAPLYGGRSVIEVVATVLGESDAKGYELVRERVRGDFAGLDFEKHWRRLLHDGVQADTASETVQPTLDGDGLARAATALGEVLGWEAPSAQRPELVFVPDARVFDGRWANNGWLQELPDAVTKVTWGNAVLMSPATARELGLAQGDLVMVGSSASGVELPVYVLPGMARSTFVTQLGYGRTAAGSVGDGVGTDTYAIRTSERMHLFRGVSLRATGRRRQLATTQDHHAIDTIGFAARNQRIGCRPQPAHR
jgi:molybdopterin-containing oxidoreductase family iron-sulfur binding subunit